MATSEPLRTKDDIQKMKTYFLENRRYRDYALFVLGVNTALRIGDLLRLTWKDIMDIKTGQINDHLTLIEQKTQKKNTVLLNIATKEALSILNSSLIHVEPDDYIFKSNRGKNKPIHRSRAYSIIHEAAQNNNIHGVICCHSMRKTFGYHAWKNGFPPALIMDIYNHSSIEITKKYLSISQDDRDGVFFKNVL